MIDFLGVFFGLFSVAVEKFRIVRAFDIRNPRGVDDKVKKVFEADPVEKGMLHDFFSAFLNSESIFEIRIQQFSDQVLRLIRQKKRKFDNSSENFLVNSDRFFVIKRRIPDQHFVEKHSESPPVHWLPISLFFSFDDFWCQIFRGPAKGVGSVFVQFFGKTEID